MRAFRLMEWQQPARLVETDVPRVGAGQVLVKVAGTGLCHSDFGMQTFTEEIAASVGWKVPFTLGHEIGGHVAAVGAGISRVSVGDPVALMTTAFCGHCWFCMRGEQNNCANPGGGRGFGRDGGLADYVLVDNELAVIRLDQLDPVTVGPLTDAGATAYHAVKRILHRAQPGSTVVVIGAGGLGSFAVQFLKVLTGARVVAVDSNESRLAIARELGADHTIVGTDDSTAETIRALGDGHGASAVLDFVGVDETITAGLASVRPGGAFGLVGAARGTLSGPLFGSLPMDGEIFTFVGPTMADTLDVIALAEQGMIRNDVELFDIADVEKAYEALRDGTLRGRAVVRFA